MNNKVPLRDGFAHEICILGQENEKIVILSPDVGKSTRALEFNKLFPDRYFCTGISEQNTIGLAAGLAHMGWIPFVVGYAMFVGGKAWEPFRSSVCYPGLNVKLIATHGGINVGQDGVTHQAVEDIAIMRAIPGLTIFIPCDAKEIGQILRIALDINGPVYIRLEREPLPIISNPHGIYKAGGSQELIAAADVTIIAIGGMVWKSMEAAEILSKIGINAGVINMYSIKPIDKEAIIRAAGISKCIITAEDHNCIGGLGSAVSEVLAQSAMIPMEMVGLKDTFAESGNAEDLFNKYHLTSKDIADAVIRCLTRV